jgi:hypothetical protein
MKRHSDNKSFCQLIKGGSCKHSTLLRQGNNYVCKKTVLSASPCSALSTACFPELRALGPKPLNKAFKHVDMPTSVILGQFYPQTFYCIRVGFNSGLLSGNINLLFVAVVLAGLNAIKLFSAIDAL